MRSPKFYKIIIVALVVLNLSTLAFYWLTKPPHPPKPGEHKISLKLELKGDAKSKVDALEVDHHKKKRALVYRDRELHKKLFNLIGTEKSVDELLEEIDKNKEEIESMTFIFFNNISEYCDENQKKELIKSVQERLNRLRPGPPPPPRR